MKEYTLTIKLQVEDPENNKYFKHALQEIESGKAKDTLTFGGITATEVKLEENESIINETNSSIHSI